MLKSYSEVKKALSAGKSVVDIVNTYLAEIKQQIQLQQQPRSLDFQILLGNSEKIETVFLLSNLARNLVTTDGAFEKINSGQYRIRIPALTQATLSYSIPIDPQQNYYISAEDLWTPVQQGQIAPTSHFTLNAKLLTGYELIDSAIGYAQDDFAFVLCKCHKYSNQDQRLNIYLLNDEPTLAATLLRQLEIYLKNLQLEK